MSYRLIQLTVPTLRALVAGDLDAASAEVGEPLTPFVLGESWLWGIRLDQVASQPDDLEWIARLAVSLDGPDAGRLVAHIGFHAAPDTHGMVEVGYTVDPAYRRRGHACALLADAIERLEHDDRVRTLRATISPDNAASLATITGLGFVENGEQWDDEDGLETIYERPV